MNDSAALGTLLSYLGIYEDGDSPVLQFIGLWAYKIYEQRGNTQTIFMYAHMLLSALFPIVIAAHASLQQPPSAAKPPKKKTDIEDEDDEIVVEEQEMAGLIPSDAITYPLLAGTVLAILYFVIKVMGSVNMLNKILTIYCSFMGVFGIAKLMSDSIDVLVSFIFPNTWSKGEETFKIDSGKSKQILSRIGQHELGINEIVSGKTNPLPGSLSKVRFHPRVTRSLWAVRTSFKKHWILRCFVHGVMNVKQSLRLSEVIGFVLGVTAITYYNAIAKAWWLTNLMGFSFSYGSLQLISPTTFVTGTLVLSSLFVYDITMVFYTPMMETVARGLDVPIKLEFPGPGGRGSMLGLGDIVLPGMLLALALRFDLYLHYYREQSKGAVDPSHPEKVSIKKVPYVEAKGLWGERFWTRNSSSSVADGARFSKVYFKSSLAGYTVGMLTTIVVCHFWKRAQPALLYLVPGVLIAVWGTALLRGEVNLMRAYTEDGKWEWDDQSGGSDDKEKSDAKSKEAIEKEKQAKSDSKHAHHVFLFSVSEPKQKSF